MWEWAYDDERFESIIPRPRRFTDLKRPAASIVKSPTAIELRRLVNCFEKDNWRRRSALVCAFTGLRINQAMRLKWSDFNFERRELHIRGELCKSRQEKRGRYIPLSAHLLDEISQWSDPPSFSAKLAPLQKSIKSIERHNKSKR